jgi:hypothetical protein
VRKVLAAFVLAAVLPLMAVINSDVFTDTNGTSLDAHTMTTGGQTWDEIGTAQIEIQSNRAITTAVQGWEHAAVESSDASVLVEADIIVPNADDYVCAINVRFADASNYHLVDVIRQAAGTPRMRIVSNVATTETVENEDTDVGAITNTTVNVTVTITGNTLNGYLNDVLTVTDTGASEGSTNTKHGISSYTGAPYGACQWDNFVIDSDPTFGGGAGATINPAKINGVPIRGGGLLRAFFRF